jgi:YHS domain-containing protein
VDRGGKIKGVIVKKVLVFSILLVLGVSLPGDRLTGVSYARTMLIPDADNKTCPVTGEIIKNKRFSRTYKGKRYWFISPAARRAFDYDPSQYKDRIETPEEGT